MKKYNGETIKPKMERTVSNTCTIVWHSFETPIEVGKLILILLKTKKVVTLKFKSIDDIVFMGIELDDLVGWTYVEEMDIPNFYVKPNSMWLAIYECRYDVIRVSADGKGFIAPGQEALWDLKEATLLKEIIPDEI